jgi:hypothetical protein
MGSKLDGYFNFNKRTGDYLYIYRNQDEDDKEGIKKQEKENTNVDAKREEFAPDISTTRLFEYFSTFMNKTLTVAFIFLFFFMSMASISVLFGGNHASIPIIIGGLVASVFITSKFHKFIKRVRTQYHDYVGESFESMIEDSRYAQAFAPTIWLVFMMLINTILVVNEPSIITFWFISVFLLVWFKEERRFEEFISTLNSIAEFIEELVEDAKDSHYDKQAKKAKKHQPVKFNKASIYETRNFLVQDTINAVILTDTEPNKPKRLYEYLDIKESDENKLAFKLGEDVSVTESIEMKDIRQHEPLHPKKKAMMMYAKDAISVEDLTSIYQAIDQISQLERDIAYEKELKQYEKQFSEGMEDETSINAYDDIIQSLEEASKQIDKYLEENQGELNQNLDKIHQIINNFQEK